MASYNGFLRKSPSHRLEQFFRSKNIEFPDDFDWNSEGRGTTFVKSIDAVLSKQSEKIQEAIKVELDHLTSLADSNGLLSAEQICAGQGLEIEGLEAVQDILLMLAMDHPNLLDRVAAQASMMRRTGGKGWSAFQFEDDGKPWALDSSEARDGFLSEAIAILELPDHRKREADWYKIIKLHPITGEEIEMMQATIYVEGRAESELAFVSENNLERRIVPKVLEVGLTSNAMDRVIEISANGGKKERDKYAQAFAKHFAPDSETPEETPRRDVQLDVLRNSPSFDIQPSDGIEKVEVSALEFYSTGGGFSKHERRGDDETLYQFLERRMGPYSPLRASGWQVTGATIRIILAPAEGKRRKTLTLTLRSPNTTTLPNKTEKDLQFVFDLLDRWNLIAPPPQDEDVLDSAA